MSSPINVNVGSNFSIALVHPSVLSGWEKKYLPMESCLVYVSITQAIKYVSVFIPLYFLNSVFNMCSWKCSMIFILVFVFVSHIGAEVAVLCITKSGEVINYQAFTNSKGTYTVAETMPESDRWGSCLARPISSFHQHCTRRGDTHSGVKFTYSKPSGNSHTVKTFLYKPANAPLYCS